MNTVFVTGGAGFIGSALVRALVKRGEHVVVNIDALTYAGNLDSLRDLEHEAGHIFVHADIRDGDALRNLFERHLPVGVYHLAAESHVDRSIDGPAEFVSTNVIGTSVLLGETLRHWSTLDDAGRSAFRFVNVSTDEVFGTLGEGDAPFSPESPYAPNSPYAASKAAADHMVRAWWKTYGLPAITTHSSNNYGPYQFPEKLIPLMVLRALAGESLPVFGKGANVRDWLHVDDHVAVLQRVFAQGVPGAVYTVGGNAERTNLEVVRRVCAVLEELRPRSTGTYESLITFVTDRPGHDFRYAVDSRRAEHELGWTRTWTFDDGIRATVQWYLDHDDWTQRVISGGYRGERLGLASRVHAGLAQ